MVTLRFDNLREVPPAIAKQATSDGDQFVVAVAQLTPSELASLVGYDPNPDISAIPQDLGH